MLKNTIEGKQRVFFEDLPAMNIDQDHIDFIALNFCKLRNNTRIGIIWPTISAKDEAAVLKIVSDFCNIIYVKKFSLSGNGPEELLRLIPEKLPTLKQDFHLYFPAGQLQFPLECIVVESNSDHNLIECKRAIRKLVGQNPYQGGAIHFCDDHNQAVDLACYLLNNNSIHFLNNKRKANFNTFNKLIPRYEQFLKKKNVSKDDVCIDGSCVLSAYGIRDCAEDFDFLCSKHNNFGNIWPLDHHNQAWSVLGFEINEVIYNPKNFFYYKGFKFTSLSKIRDFKSKQGRPRDIEDVKLINFIK